MSKKYKVIIKIIVFIIAAIMISALSFYHSSIIKHKYNSVSIRLGGNDTVMKKDLEKALEDEKNRKKENTKITAWNCHENNEIYAYDIYKYDFLAEMHINNSEKNIKKEKVKLYEVYGDCKEVRPMDLLCGNFLMDDDIYGCIIDKETCYSLFGTENGLGNSISLNNKVYYVRGVAETDSPLIMIQVNDMKHEFRNLELFYDNDERSKEMAENFMLQNGIGNEYSVYDCEFYGKAAQKFSYIPICIVIIFVLKKYCDFIYINKHNKKKVIIYGAFMAVFIISAVYITKFEFYYPLRLIPSKWSDFKFWKDRFDEIKVLIYEFTYIMTYERDIMMVQHLKKSIMLSVISCINEACILYYMNIIARRFMKQKSLI